MLENFNEIQLKNIRRIDKASDEIKLILSHMSYNVEMTSMEFLNEAKRLINNYFDRNILIEEEYEKDNYINHSDSFCNH